jgi:hypothetical protein
VREAVELRRWPDAIDYITVVADTLNKASTRLDEATDALTPKFRQAAPGKPQGAVPRPPSDS